MSNRELLEGALKRVNALAGVSGKLYNDNTGWFIIWKNHVFDESARTAGEMISYLHGIEDEGKVFVEQETKKEPTSNAKQTEYTYKAKDGKTYPIYLSKNGKAFIVRVSKKSGKEYRQYLPEVTEQLNKK